MTSLDQIVDSMNKSSEILKQINKFFCRSGRILYKKGIFLWLIRDIFIRFI